MSKEFGVFLDNNEHSDILLLAEDGGRYEIAFLLVNIVTFFGDRLLLFV